MNIESFLQAVNQFEKRNYKQLKNVSKPVVGYLLKEIQDVFSKNKVSTNKQRGNIRLFEITFADESITIVTFCKCESEHIKCFSCQKEQLIEAIQLLCCELDLKIENSASNIINADTTKLNIGYNIQEKANH
jgi:hypothetical protein